MSNPYQAVQVPPAALERGGVEILRCGIVDEELHVTLRPAFDDPQIWGRVLAEVARQVARVYAHEKKFTEADALKRIGSMFDADMQSSPDASSAIAPIG
jgi:hypothetical protein